MSEAPSIRWRNPEELVEIGFSRSRVVMMNEAHNGWLRCVRTRTIGTRVLPVAHAAGVRHLAMEALFDPDLVKAANESRHLPEVRGPSYLAQPEMRVLIQTAIDLGWTLLGYEADMRLAPDGWDPMGEAFTNWREEHQARNLLKRLDGLASNTQVLVWCGNGHLDKDTLGGDRTRVPMGSWIHELSAIEPFAIDQTQTVEFGHPRPETAVELHEAPRLGLEVAGWHGRVPH